MSSGNELFEITPQMVIIEAVAAGKVYFNRPGKPDASSIATMVSKERLYVIQDTSATSKNCIGIVYPAKYNDIYAIDAGGWYAVAGQRVVIVQRGNVHVRVGASWDASSDPLCTIHASGVQAQGGSTNMTLARALIPTSSYVAGDYAYVELLNSTGLAHSYNTGEFESDEAITVEEGVAKLTKSASAGAYTLAPPTAGVGQFLLAVADTAKQHVITLTSGTWGNNGTKNKVTFGGAKGDSVLFAQIGIYWYVIALHNVTEGAA